MSNHIKMYHEISQDCKIPERLGKLMGIKGLNINDHRLIRGLNVSLENHLGLECRLNTFSFFYLHIGHTHLKIITYFADIIWHLVSTSVIKRSQQESVKVFLVYPRKSIEMDGTFETKGGQKQPKPQVDVGPVSCPPSHVRSIQGL